MTNVDEDPAALEKDPELKTVPSDIKKLIRSLLKRFPAERASFDDFFSSTALAKSKFPRPTASPHASTSTAANGMPVPSQEGHTRQVVTRDKSVYELAERCTLVREERNASRGVSVHLCNLGRAIRSRTWVGTAIDSNEASSVRGCKANDLLEYVYQTSEGSLGGSETYWH